MPSSNKNVVMLKLDNGYNIGFQKKEVKSMTTTKKKPSVKKTSTKSKKGFTNKTEKGKTKVTKKKNLKTVSILHCGGTIASKVDYETGAVKAKFKPEELMEMFPELGKIINIKSRLVANMMSENMRFAHYNQIAKEIEKEKTDGIIITHGTDMLHYTAAALAFILEDLNIPVILVGAQRSSDRGSSDAFMNLKCAANFIAQSDFAEVAICMHSSTEDKTCSILPGVKSRKLHSSRRDAFQAVNSEPFASVNEEGKINWLRKTYVKQDGKRKLQLKLFKEKKIGFLKAHPQMFSEELNIFEKFDGLILEGTGLGHFPTEKYDNNTKEHELITKAIEKLTKKIPVVMTTQTIFGGVNMNVYSPGRKLSEVGVLGNGQDLPAETAFIKLGWLLSNFEKSEISNLWNMNFRGEISNKRSFKKDFLGVKK